MILHGEKISVMEYYNIPERFGEKEYKQFLIGNLALS